MNYARMCDMGGATLTFEKFANTLDLDEVLGLVTELNRRYSELTETETNEVRKAYNDVVSAGLSLAACCTEGPCGAGFTEFDDVVESVQDAIEGIRNL